MSDPLDPILAKIKAARDHLATYPPVELGWPVRCESAARELVPWLWIEASALKAYVERILNAAELVREEWRRLRPEVIAPAERIAAFESALGAFKFERSRSHSSSLPTTGGASVIGPPPPRSSALALKSSCV